MTTSRDRLRFSRRALLAWWITAAAASLGATLMAAGPACAAVNPQAFETAFQQFQQAVAGGDEKAIESAAEQFGHLAASEPTDPVLLAYSGAATSMRATTTMLPWRKMSFADNGLGQIDKALSLLGSEHDTLLHRGTPSSTTSR